MKRVSDTLARDKQGGFTIFVAVLVVSVLLSVSLGLAEITIKENLLSSYLQESQTAFYAADRGVDCALFWGMSFDRYLPPSGPLQFSPFPTSTVGVSYDYPPNWNTITCLGTNLSSAGWSVSNETATGATTKFHLDFIDGSCADIAVEVNSGTTVYRAQGFNTCNTANPRRTQRTLEVSTNL